MKPVPFPPGTLFLVPLEDGTWAPGLITHVGKTPIMFATFGVCSLPGETSADEALRALRKAPRWRPFIGRLGFTMGGWKVLGTVKVPWFLRKLPYFADVINEPPHRVDPITLLPTTLAPRVPRRKAVEAETCGHVYVTDYISRLLSERSGGR